MSDGIRSITRAQLTRAAVVAAPLTISLVVLLASWQWHGRQARAAEQWRERAVQCVQLGEAIETLRAQPRVFEDRVVESHTLAAYIEEASRRSGMQQDQIQAIRPEHPQRVPETDYVQTYTRVRMGEVSVEQLIRLIWHLHQDVRGLAIPELRIWSTTRDAQRWEAEMSIVGLAYVPAEKRNR